MPPGNLAVEDLGLDADELAEELAVARTNLGEVISNPKKPLQSSRVLKPVPSSISTRASVGLWPGPERHGTDRGVHDVAPGFDRLHQATRVTPVVAWTWTWTRVSWPHFLDALHQVVGRLRLQQAGHVLDADGIAAHFAQLLRHLDEGFDSVQRAGRVADGALGVLAGAVHGRDTGAQIADVVERVEDAEDVHAVLGGLVHEALHHAVFVVPVAQQVLPAQQHLQARVRHQLAEGAQTLPGIFVEEADAGVEGGPAPAFDDQ